VIGMRKVKAAREAKQKAAALAWVT
jgi:hypothetical protein